MSNLTTIILAFITSLLLSQAIDSTNYKYPQLPNGASPYRRYGSGYYANRRKSLIPIHDLVSPNNFYYNLRRDLLPKPQSGIININAGHHVEQPKTQPQIQLNFSEPKLEQRWSEVYNEEEEYAAAAAQNYRAPKLLTPTEDKPIQYNQDNGWSPFGEQEEILPTEHTEIENNNSRRFPFQQYRSQYFNVPPPVSPNYYSAVTQAPVIAPPPPPSTPFHSASNSAASVIAPTRTVNGGGNAGSWRSRGPRVIFPPNSGSGGEFVSFRDQPDEISDWLAGGTNLQDLGTGPPAGSFPTTGVSTVPQTPQTAEQAAASNDRGKLIKFRLV